MKNKKHHYIIIIEDDGKQDKIPFDKIQDAIRIDLDSGLTLKNIYEAQGLAITETVNTFDLHFSKGD